MIEPKFIELHEVCNKCYVTPKWADEIYHVLREGRWLCEKCYDEDRAKEVGSK